MPTGGPRVTLRERRNALYKKLPPLAYDAASSDLVSQITGCLYATIYANNTVSMHIETNNTLSCLCCKQFVHATV